MHTLTRPSALVIPHVSSTSTVAQLSIRGAPAERLTIGLFGEHVPRTVENFVGLIKGETMRRGKKLGYAGSKLHRIINGFMAQGGDITRGDGRGGDSIWGGAFADESFHYKHNKAGRLSMANAGKNTNKSRASLALDRSTSGLPCRCLLQGCSPAANPEADRSRLASAEWFITFRPTPHLNGKHVVFGQVEGADAPGGHPLLKKLEAIGTRSGKPSATVEIVACGVADVAGR
jgi:peptidyl-prolyl isomerase G (cyclophilin G)